MMGRVLLPGFVAAGTGALVFTGVGGLAGLHTRVAVADRRYPLTTPCASPTSPGASSSPWRSRVVVVGIKHLAHAAGGSGRHRGRNSRSSSPALLVGVLAVGFRALADRPVDLVLFSGQTELPDVVAEGSASVLLLLVVAKGLAYALSLGAGFRGGPVFPGASRSASPWR